MVIIDCFLRTEKNACQWSKDKLNALLVGMILENKETKCEIIKIETCEGEAVANNRKGKLIFFYEWDLTLNWKGHLSGADKEIEGTINIPNLSEENGVSEIEVIFLFFVNLYFFYHLIL